MKCSVSLGSVDAGAMKALKAAGADRFHHNLETSEDYFPRICTTHTYKERLNTIEAAKKAGFSVCSGALFGLGEARRDRIKLALLLRGLGVGSVPLNFLHPIEGTPLEKAKPMPPGEILRTIAVFRLILPEADIKICGGRAANLRSLQPLIFMAGSSGMMIGNYLTRPGPEPAVDLQMIQDLGLRVT
jgi:biotin synthase